MRKENLPFFHEALEQLSQETGVWLRDQEQDQTAQKVALYEVNEAAARYFHDLLLHHVQATPARRPIWSGAIWMPRRPIPSSLGFHSINGAGSAII